MRLDTPFKNEKLEAKRQAALRRQESEAVLRQHAAKSRAAPSLRKLRGRAKAGSPFGRLMVAVLANSRARADELATLPAVRAAADWSQAWVREPEDWVCRTHNANRQASSLVRHLLCRFAVPEWFVDTFAAGNREQQAWFVHVGAGLNLRTVPGLPIALTKRQAHEAMLAPASAVSNVVEAIRYGQAVAAGAPPAVARALGGTFLGRQFAGEGREPFWSSFIDWLGRETADAAMFDAEEVGQLLDYLSAQRFGANAPQPRLSMKGRTLATLVRQTHQWHEQLARERRAADRARRRVGRSASYEQSWPSSGIGGFEHVEGQGETRRVVRVVELLDANALFDEGRRLHHCVGSYAYACSSGRCAIFSMRVGQAGDIAPRVTIEVLPREGQIVQARGACNRPPTAQEGRWLRQWAGEARLAISRHVSRLLAG